MEGESRADWLTVLSRAGHARPLRGTGEDCKKNTESENICCFSPSTTKQRLEKWNEGHTATQRTACFTNKNQTHTNVWLLKGKVKRCYCLMTMENSPCSSSPDLLVRLWTWNASSSSIWDEMVQGSPTHKHTLLLILYMYVIPSLHSHDSLCMSTFCVASLIQVTLENDYKCL